MGRFVARRVIGMVAALYAVIVRHVSDRVAVMNLGKLVGNSGTDGLYERTLEGDVPTLESA